MARAKRCPVCLAAPDTTSRVNALLESGVKMAGIVNEVGQFNVYQLSRHKNRCLTPVTPELPANAGADELHTWMQRCTDSYHLAVSNGDSRSAIAACSAATRQLAALAKRREREAEAVEKSADNPNRPASIADLDQRVREFMAQRASAKFTE